MMKMTKFVSAFLSLPWTDVLYKCLNGGKLQPLKIQLYFSKNA